MRCWEKGKFAQFAEEWAASIVSWWSPLLNITALIERYPKIDEPRKKAD
jgi:hypothetical protein